MRARQAVLPLIVALLLMGYLVAAYFVSVPTTVTTTSMTTTTSTATSTVTFGNPVVFNYSTLPPQFEVGNYLVTMTQGINYTVAIGTRTYDYFGFYTTFEVFPLKGGLAYDTLFFWNTTSGPSSTHPPYDAYCFVMRNGSSGCPFSVTTSGVSVVWTMADSTFWVSFTFKWNVA